MDNLVEKVLCVELIERIARMRRFVMSDESHAEGSGTEVANAFLRTLEGILNDMSGVTSVLSDRRKLLLAERIGLVRKLTRLTISICELHWNLGSIRGDWVRPETRIILDNAFEIIPEDRRPRNASIILSNEYSFEELDFKEEFESQLRKHDLFITLKETCPTVVLPKTERDNPLNWASLIHECGHIDKEGMGSLLADDTLFPDKASSEMRRKLNNWASEFYCDLFASRILGPAYLASFAGFVLLDSGRNVTGDEDLEHPPDALRIAMIHRFLERHRLQVGIDEGFAAGGDVATLFYRLTEDISELQRRHLADKIELRSDVHLTDFCDRIVSHLEDVIASQHEQPSHDSSTVSILARRLKDGVLIGSFPGPHDKVAKACARLRAAFKSRDNAKIAAVYNEAKEVAQERRALPWDIINAGWLHKITTIYPQAFGMFFPEKRPLAKSIDEYDSILLHTDRVLLKSIEASQVHAIFGGEHIDAAI